MILLHEVGLRPLAVPRRLLRVTRPVEVVHGAKSARLVPCDHFEVSYSIGFDHPLLRHQALTLRVTPRSFTDFIAPARTFGFLREVELLRKSGLALGGSLENAVVIGETGVLNNKLRFEDEFVRHKILDAIGDLALLGHPILGRLEATKAGHALHAAVAQQAGRDARRLRAGARRAARRHGGRRPAKAAASRAGLKPYFPAGASTVALIVTVRSDVFGSFERTSTCRSILPE